MDMNSKPSPVVPGNENTRQQLLLYTVRMATWLAILFFSRSILLVTGITLMIPITLFLFSLLGSMPDAWPALWRIFYWPWALTGRTSFDENDISLLVGSWAVLITVVISVVQKLLPSFKVKFRSVLLTITAIYAVTSVGTLIDTVPQDRWFAFGALLVLYIVCIGSIGFSWGLHSVSAFLKRSSSSD